MLSLSVVAALSAAGWWWVTWPERTAREFEYLWNNGRTDEARAFLSSKLKEILKVRDQIILERHLYGEPDVHSGPLSEAKLSWKLERTQSDLWRGELMAYNEVTYVKVSRGSIVDIGQSVEGVHRSLLDQQASHEELLVQWKKLRLRRDQLKSRIRANN